MSALQQFLDSNGFSFIIEGYSQQVPGQVRNLIELTSAPHINVMEIGFNAGHSAELFLKNNETLTLTSFDLGYHNYVKVGKKYIDMAYPNRHTLILGDSTVMVPQYINNNPTNKFDVIFIDGGHDYSIAKADLDNCMRLAHKDTIVLIDDTIYTPGWERNYTIGPTKAWIDHLITGKISGINRVDYAPGRGMSWGKYVL